MNDRDIDAIKNHIGNIPSVAPLYVPELIAAVEALLAERAENKTTIERLTSDRELLRNRVERLEAVVERVRDSLTDATALLDIPHPCPSCGANESMLARMRSDQEGMDVIRCRNCYTNHLIPEDL